jgi:hypothetical protein
MHTSEIAHPSRPSQRTCNGFISNNHPLNLQPQPCTHRSGHFFVSIGEQDLLFLRLAAVPREVAVNAGVEAPPDRRLRFMSSLSLGLCEHELVVTPFVTDLTVPSGTLVEHPQPTKRLFEWHRLDVVELLDAGHRRIQPIRDGVEELLHHGGVIEGHAKTGIPRC